MTTTQTRSHALTAAVSVAIATMAVPALLTLGVGTAQATPDISTFGPVGVIGDLPVPAFNPQPDPPGDTDPGSEVGLGGPDTKVDVGPRIGSLSPAGPERASSSLNPGETVGIILHG